MKEKLQEYALIAEIIGGIAIVTSLIFVGVQINQGSTETALNTKAIQISAYQDLIDQISILNILRVESPVFAELYGKFITGHEPEPAAEDEQLKAFLVLSFRQGELAFKQFENGILNEDNLISVLTPPRAFASVPFGKIVWESFSPNFDQKYVEYMNTLGPICGGSQGC